MLGRMADFVPVDFTKDGETETATTPGEYFQLVYEGWIPEGGIPPQALPRNQTPVFQTDLDVFATLTGTIRKFFLTPSVFITAGTGTPEGVVTAPVGSIFLRTDGAAGTTFYVKQTGTAKTGWAAK